MTKTRPPITPRDIPAILLCYAIVWTPIILAIVATAKPDIILEFLAK